MKLTEYCEKNNIKMTIGFSPLVGRCIDCDMTFVISQETKCTDDGGLVCRECALMYQEGDL